MRNKLIQDTQVEMHQELARTLEDVLERKRKGDIIIKEVGHWRMYV